MKVFVTGAAARFADVLLPLLCAQDAVEQVIGVDSKPLRVQHAKLHARQADIDDPHLHTLFIGCSALVHLGFVAPTKNANRDRLFESNVRSAHKIFHAAHARGVERLIHLSTAAVYGSAIHANEDSPLKPLREFTYAEHSARLEELLAIDFPNCVRLRPHVIVGRHAHPLVRALLKQPFYTRFADEEPLFQCVHESDVAHAVVACLRANARGAYNLAIDRSFRLRDALRARHRIAVPLPEFAAYRGIALAARLAHTDVEAGWVNALSRPLLINCRRAIIDLGWNPRYTAEEALQSV